MTGEHRPAAAWQLWRRLRARRSRDGMTPLAPTASGAARKDDRNHDARHHADRYEGK
jgi:hypothetical protein